jgi:fumarylacetoacetase
MRHLYWSCAQQLAHHSVSGCPMKPGDLLGTGTISGDLKGSYGSLLEITWGGKNPFKLGEE